MAQCKRAAKVYEYTIGLRADLVIVRYKSNVGGGDTAAYFFAKFLFVTPLLLANSGHYLLPVTLSGSGRHLCIVTSHW